MAQNEYDLEGVLEKCRKAASDGYKIASEHTAYIKDTLQDAEKEVQATLDDFKKSQVYDSGVTDKLCGQLEEIKSRFGMLSDAFNDDLESIEQNISKFFYNAFRQDYGREINADGGPDPWRWQNHRKRCPEDYTRRKNI